MADPNKPQCILDVCSMCAIYYSTFMLGIIFMSQHEELGLPYTLNIKPKRCLGVNIMNMSSKYNDLSIVLIILYD